MIRRQIQFLVLEGKYVRFFGKDSGDRSAKQLALGKVYQNLWDGGRLIPGEGGFWTHHEGGAKKFEHVAKRGANNFGHVVKGGAEKF